MIGWKEFYEQRQDKLKEEAVRLSVFGSLDKFVSAVLSQSCFQPERKRREIIALAICCSAGTVYETTDGSLYEYFLWFADTVNKLMIAECKSHHWYVMGSIGNFFQLIKDSLVVYQGDYQKAADELGISCNKSAMRKAVTYMERVEEHRKQRGELLRHMEGGVST